MANRFVLRNQVIRTNAMQAILDAGDNYVVTIAQPTRSNDQNSMFHAICSDMAKSGHKFAGKPRSLEEWKALLISGHAVATGSAGEVIPGLEGEFVAIRESSAKMGVARAASLITYTLAYCDTNGIPLTETHKGGFLELQERSHAA
jgi:hypothetical protein